MPGTLRQDLEEKYSLFYDIKEPPFFIPFPVELYAHFYQRNEKYFATKSINLWRLDHEEHCFVKKYDSLTQTHLAEMIDVLKQGIGHLVNPHPNHMKTFLTGVFITREKVSPELVRFVEKFKYSKAFKFYLYGWCDLRLVILDLSSRQVICNAAGREVRKFYENLLGDIHNQYEKEVYS